MPLTRADDRDGERRWRGPAARVYARPGRPARSPDRTYARCDRIARVAGIARSRRRARWCSGSADAVARAILGDCRRVNAAGLGRPGPSAGPAAFQRPPFVFGETTPDPRVLATFQSPGQTIVDHRATAANGLGLLDLQQRGPGVSDGEEQLRVLVTADRAVTPIHWSISPLPRATAGLRRRRRACEFFHELGRASRSV